MKIKVYHRECGREMLVQQILESQGHCPWDGKPFNKDYTAILAEALEAAEAAGGRLENALEKIAGMEPNLSIQEDTILLPLRNHLDHLNRDRSPASL
ncbi:hypothetical protein BH20ACT24_BH20ACT24_02120 [soil metagenome]|nr:hypothetical protein [Actinomycetota bacterium]